MLNISELSLVQKMFRLKCWHRLTSGGFHTNNLHFLYESGGWFTAEVWSRHPHGFRKNCQAFHSRSGTKNCSKATLTFPVVVVTVYTSLQ